MAQTPTSQRRLKGALAFSLFAVPVIALSVWVLPYLSFGYGHELAQGWITAAAATAGIFAVWLLIASLLEMRPAWSQPLGRWLWLWTAACCVLLGAAGFTHASSDTIGSVLLYACGLISVVWGAVGLVVALIPPRARRDFYGRRM